MSKKLVGYQPPYALGASVMLMLNKKIYVAVNADGEMSRWVNSPGYGGLVEEVAEVMGTTGVIITKRVSCVEYEVLQIIPGN